jgi:hypothetical protein
MLEAPICTMRAMAAEADAACQFKTGALIRHEIMRQTAKIDLPPPGDNVRDLAPEECLAARAPRIVMQAAPQTTIVTQVAQDQGQEQVQPAPPPAAAPVAPRRTGRAAPPPKSACSNLPQCGPEGKPLTGAAR